MVELDQLLQEEMRPIYWVVDDIHVDDALVFTNLNLVQAEKVSEEMGALDQKNRLETICIGSEVDDRITPDILQKIILEENQADWPDEPLIHSLPGEERKSNS